MDEPPEKPDAPTVSSRRATQLSVSWTAPSNTGPPIDGYDLRYRETGDSGWDDGPQNLDANSATLDNLTEGTAYEVQVKASNAEGESVWSSSGGARPRRRSRSCKSCRTR